MYIGLHVKYSSFFSDFNEKWLFWTDFRKTLKSRISWKSIQWDPSICMRAEGPTDMTKLIVALSNCTKVLKSGMF